MAAPTAEPVAPEPRPTPGSARAGGRARFVARLAGSVAGGALLYLSFPPRPLWWLALPAFALLGSVLRRPWPAGRLRLGLPVRARVPAAAAGLDRQLRRSAAVGGAVRAAGAVRRPGRGRDGGWSSRLPAAPVLAARRCGWPGRRCAPGCPFGGLPWGRVGLRPARRPAAAAGRGRRRAAAVVRHRAGRARARRAAAPAGRPGRLARGRGPCAAAGARAGRRPAGRAGPTDRRRPGADGDHRRGAGQRAPARARTSTPSAGPCWTTTCGSPSSWPQTSRPAAPRSRTW